MSRTLNKVRELAAQAINAKWEVQVYFPSKGWQPVASDLYIQEESQVYFAPPLLRLLAEALHVDTDLTQLPRSVTSRLTPRGKVPVVTINGVNFAPGSVSYWHSLGKGKLPIAHENYSTAADQCFCYFVELSPTGTLESIDYFSSRLDDSSATLKALKAAIEEERPLTVQGIPHFQNVRDWRRDASSLDGRIGDLRRELDKLENLQQFYRQQETTAAINMARMDKASDAGWYTVRPANWEKGEQDCPNYDKCGGRINKKNPTVQVEDSRLCLDCGLALQPANELPETWEATFRISWRSASGGYRNFHLADVIPGSLNHRLDDYLKGHNMVPQRAVVSLSHSGGFEVWDNDKELGRGSWRPSPSAVLR